MSLGRPAGTRLPAHDPVQQSIWCNPDPEGEGLWLVRKGDIERFEATVNQTGYRLQPLGDVEALRNYRVYRVNSPGAGKSTP